MSRIAPAKSEFRLALLAVHLADPTGWTWIYWRGLESEELHMT